jgi:YfiH family protein
VALLFLRISSDGLAGYRSPALEALGVPHLFTTRNGGAGGALDLARVDGELGRRLAAAAGAPGAEIVRVRQVHGRAVVDADQPLPEPPPEADALLVSRPGRLVAARVADCVPVLLASPGGERVAAVHAGWRGLVAGAVPAALAALGPCAAAAVGPCLSAARFEVGPEVAALFRAADLGETVEERPGERPRVDLRRAAELQLARAGVGAIDTTDRCTFEHAGEFFSHRRDVTRGGQPSTGRMAAVIGAARR